LVYLYYFSRNTHVNKFVWGFRNEETPRPHAVCASSSQGSYVVFFHKDLQIMRWTNCW